MYYQLEIEVLKSKFFYHDLVSQFQRPKVIVTCIEYSLYFILHLNLTWGMILIR